MKRLAFIAIFAVISVYFVGCGIGGDSSNVDSKNADLIESKSIESPKIETLSSEDYSHLPECRNSEDYVKGCLRIDEHESGKHRVEFPFKNSKINGIAREYFADKTICEMQIVDAMSVSASVCFDKNGKLKNGVMKEYYDNGNLAFEYMFKNGRKEGIIKLYYENGVLMTETPYKDGKREGVEKGYYKDGGLRFEIPFKNNKIEGVEKLYSDGLCWLEAPYKNGKREGVVKKYYPNGNLEMEMSYKNGKKEGAVKEYNYNGKLIWEYHI